ncbi:hypothetical protein QCD83_18675 [Pseudomonas savastanoi pv. phaseolicola]|uniref:AlgX/AlgJ SGNH hydrolase-like domain-containing protein n=2 Tax=Pseudomonas savastanoi TaxID=29438 RepID=A0A3M3FR36_PSESG|nr:MULTISPECIES: hypothetical protein [Pseudomonas]AAZ37245.1 hypothetical protein PSPPH_0971 [Pseudomonas savastanoi pv. phaseolicola 1448A]KPB45528.1 Uncharacterized protein AC513_0088 [Pseudomonas savastanoi pv. phaseolicola]KPB45907.1 Uncharacterized protein AC514_2783 [Pseudomonas savastanoi pv. phaseolicola]KPB65191.1 Uncharacterized protein AC512_0083 [Pseudomonas savastanoi pv. phaseolicola]KPB65579.1 Uncharacterized protein AC508_3041 [Pseudomonas amygdali pv. mellea]
MNKILNFVPSKASAVKELLKGWNIEEPGAEISQVLAEEYLKVSGWAVGHRPIKKLAVEISGEIYYADLDTQRPDVIEALFSNAEGGAHDNSCGFSIIIASELSSVASFDIGFIFEEKIEWVGTFFFEAPQKVLIGKHQWLFLDNDSNDSVDQFTGMLEFPVSDQEKWKTYISDIQSISTINKFEWLMVLAPSKEYVFQDYYPHELSENNTPSQFMRLFEGHQKIVYPLNLLIHHRELSYWKGDTHWTDYGAYIIFKDTLERFHLPVLNFDTHCRIEFSIKNSIGDLSEKLPGHAKQPKVQLSDCPHDHSEFVIYDNRIPNNGRIIISENAQPLCSESILIFGSSSAYNLVKFFQMYFRRVVLVHSAAELDMEIINHEKPKYVLLQSNSRFINVAPEYLGTHSVRRLTSSKIENFSALEVRKIMKLQDHSLSANEVFYSSML